MKKSIALPESGRFTVGPGVRRNGSVFTSIHRFSQVMFSGKSNGKPSKSFSLSSLSNNSSNTITLLTCQEGLAYR